MSKNCALVLVHGSFFVHLHVRFSYELWAYSVFSQKKKKKRLTKDCRKPNKVYFRN